MITLIIAIISLILGYVIYGRYIAKFFGASSQIETPAKRLADGVDYIPLKPWKI